jgi:hypothetical protein
MLLCTKCYVRKPATEFSNYKKLHHCKTCVCEKAKKWSKDNPEYKHGQGLQKKKYWPGLDAKQAHAKWKEIFDAQNGQCAICGIPQESEDRRLAVDHCHKTGKVRELLCMKCNRGMGMLADDPERIQKIVKYLQKHV